MGSVGDSYDNALAETIIGLYKTEVIRTRGPWKTMDDVEYATLEWGPTGSTIVACWRPSAMYHRLSMKRCTMMGLIGHAKRHDSNCVFHSKAAIHYTAKLPPISHESCHPLHGKAATFEEVDNRRV